MGEIIVLAGVGIWESVGAAACPCPCGSVGLSPKEKEVDGLPELLLAHAPADSQIPTPESRAPLAT